jgi:hypothetical protein
MTNIVGTLGLQVSIPASALQQIQWANAAGTADSITAAYATPNVALTDGLILGFRASASNATTTPQFSPDGLTTATITKYGGQALAIGDIPGALAEVLVRYNLANTRWELLNPKFAQASGISSAPVSKTATYAILNADKGKSFYFGGAAYYTVTLGAAAGFDSDFRVQIINSDTRGKLISISGITAFILWPSQTITVTNTGGTWSVDRLYQRWKPTTGQTFYVNPSGSDSNDGLATGSANAFATIAGAYAMLKNIYDSGNGTPTIKLDDGTHLVGAGVNLNYQIPTGANQLFITGNTSTRDNVIVQCSAGGACFNGRDGQGTATITYMKLRTSGNGSSALMCSQFYQVDWGNITFDTFPSGIVISVSDMGSVDIVGDYSVIGNCATFMSVLGRSKSNYGTYTGNLPNALTFTLWLAVSDGGYINAGGSPPLFTGTGAAGGSTGKKYAISSQGQAATSGATIPGATVGTADSATYSLFS